jgi:peroxiredoxin
MMGILPVVQRVSFLVGPDGRIEHVWPQVNAARHAADVLEEVRRRGQSEAVATA